MNTPILDGIRKLAMGNPFGATSAVPASTILPPKYLKNQSIMKNLGGFGRFLAKHPKGAGIAGMAALVGGSMLGGKMIANQQKGNWYNQGHQAATRTYAPMVGAKYGTQGAMSMPQYARR